ncbi:SDR family NAD(P)-dependent oxidoreductase [Labedaea rhizosphaerae]|uniref:Short-subunit dehydrogenase n=1 Tax=Labedaea rhizosphaerae TaxID=598644 RepID=A0A4R6RVR0_LABRH|nr:SDR family NAD(P)-dependent oxidoreductase [Labedaea rhizosphaerae]TDP91081.1 short-subunit dehydrogenase [Labedaea rhizosphaerae]
MSGAVVVGAGPGIGRAVAARFAREGLPVAVIARRARTVRDTAATLREFAVPVVELVADSTDEAGLRAALDKAAAELGPPDVLVYNAAVIQADGVGDLTARGHLDAYAVNVVGAHTAAAHVAPWMAERGHGTIIVTGGMPAPVPGYVSLSIGKAAVRTLLRLVAEQFGPSGVHVATVTVRGAVAPGTDYDPDDIAEHYWRLHAQPAGAWEFEVVH